MYKNFLPIFSTFLYRLSLYTYRQEKVPPVLFHFPFLEEGIPLLESQYPAHTIHLRFYTWQEPLLAAAQAIGCMVYRTYHTMGMRLG